ncbi:Moulting cycle MLT-10-like protein family-containing protein [Aphelenchoides besseyi]|nr:Moulting cycle MLT-10-like protein family-containing protein [Aphelenchoides besseyi]
MSLLKAKAKFELEKLPFVESVVFNQCSSTATSSNSLAECVRRLINERKRREIHRQQLSDFYSTQQFNENNRNVQNLTVNRKLVSANHFDSKSYFETKIQRLQSRKRNLRLLGRYRHSTRILFNGKANQRKRRSANAIPECSQLPSNVEKLRKIEEYFRIASDCAVYARKLERKTERLLNRLNVSVRYQNRNSPSSSTERQLQSLVDDFNSRTLSLLSPKIMNVIPTNSKQDGQSKFFSPTLLSFHSSDGLLPLPQLLKLFKSQSLKMSTTSECETIRWLDLLLEITGGARRLDDFLRLAGPQFKRLNEGVLTKVKEVHEMEEMLENSLTFTQKSRLKRFGYTSMTVKQLQFIYSNQMSLFSNICTETLSSEDSDVSRLLMQMHVDPNEKWLEELICDLAEQTVRLNNTNRQKRQSDVASPSAFINQIGTVGIVNNFILSPRAFVVELMRARVVGVGKRTFNYNRTIDVLDPRAFVASILSPAFVTARALSPSAFRLSVLSPLTFSGSALVPEAFLTSVLSPATFTTRVLAPDALLVSILSPATGSIRVLSPSYLSLRILSPALLTMGFMSKGDLNMEILSPSFLSINDPFSDNFTASSGASTVDVP